MQVSVELCTSYDLKPSTDPFISSMSRFEWWRSLISTVTIIYYIVNYSKYRVAKKLRDSYMESFILVLSIIKFVKMSTFRAIFMSDYRYDCCSSTCVAGYWTRIKNSLKYCVIISSFRPFQTWDDTV